MMRLFALNLLCFIGVASSLHGDSKPNVLILFIDDMGYADPSCFGNPLIKTPHIDRLAEGGLKLTHFYVNSPICSASRTALSTGQYQQRWRINSFLSGSGAQKRRKMANYLQVESIHTAQVFKDAGYRTAHFGKWHLGGGRDVGDAPLPTEYGFDESYVSFEGLGDRVLFGNGRNAEMSEELGRGKILHAPKHDTTKIYVDKAIDFIGRGAGVPFYLEVYPNDVHDAFIPRKGRAEDYADLTDNPEERKFLAVLADMDAQIGRLLDALDKEGQAGNTIVIFTSDNGPTDWPRYYENGIDPPGFTGPFFGRKWSLHEGGIRMPFIIRWPAKIAAGRTDEESVVAAMDLQRSLASMTGIQTPDAKAYDGEDMSEALLGKGALRKKPIFWEYGVYGSIKPGKKEFRSPFLAMREGRWKFLANPDGSDAMLFDLKKDQGETTNLADKMPKKAGEMKAQLLAWWGEMELIFE
ncbi:MAG: sulfatase-like hydrolase/transferase [Verrucomicrobiota bacterium]